jgi:hypothetical protein
VRERRIVYRVSVGTPEEHRESGRHRCRWVDAIKIGLKKPLFWMWIYFIWLRRGACVVVGTKLCILPISLSGG